MPKRIEKKELPLLADLEHAVFHAPWSEEALALLCGESAFGFVCMEQGIAAAYGGMLTVLDEGQITNVAVHPDFRRRGLGRAILSYLKEEARARGLLQIALEVRVSNEAAIALYESEKFYVAGRRKNFYRNPTEDALVMLWDASDRK